jgi:hypothetical protein
VSVVSRPERASGARRERAGVLLADRLRRRRAEIEEAVLTRVYAVSEPPRGAEPEYLDGLRGAVWASIEYGLAGIERGERAAPPLPEVLLAQARLAARSAVSLDTVLRRYLAGHALLEDFLIEEAQSRLGPKALAGLLRSQATLADRLLAAVSAAYSEEAARRPESTEQRRAERVERLLAGEPLDTADLGYELGAHHLGILAAGPGAREEVMALTRSTGTRCLAVRREEGALWAWLGSSQCFDPVQLDQIAALELPQGLSLAFGEPGEGIAGWRLTHRQARAALGVSMRKPGAPTRYREVALLASIMQDELLAASLRALYLEPLERQRDGGVSLRETLIAYFAADCNVSSAAAALGVTRHTVTNRLRMTEELLGRALHTCAVELEAALRLQELGIDKMSISHQPIYPHWASDMHHFGESVTPP